VFGYGSLMWRPDFPYRERATARLNGWHRALCVWSWWHRGSQARPGLVMGLDRGGTCIGRAYRVAATDRAQVLDYLAAREMVTPVYVPRRVGLRVHGGTAAEARVAALTFGVDRSHPQFAGRLAPEVAAETVLRATGRSGANPDYLFDALRHLAELGLRDPRLEAVARLVRRHLEATAPPGQPAPGG